MSAQRHDSGLLGAYVLGVLDPDESRAVEEHLAGCTGCRTEAGELRRLKASLGEVPPEAFLDGPPDGGDLLLQRTLRQVREERRTAEWRRRSAQWAVAVVAAAAVLAGGLIAGRSLDDSGGAPPGAGSVTTVTPTPPPPPEGIAVASARDPRTGARLVVRVTPAHAWVRIDAAVTGIPAGELCRLVVVSRDGERKVAGGWRAGGAEKGAALDGSAAVPREEVAAVVVENEEGRAFVTARIGT
ncbi:zf-HC2 domain-containing protein [Streptomyces yaizuensis]|uniref:Zf-HC2 domain-containing protein n=1 Tax=Streptomyces yaizuensis TaxID=2989713 RepID=A0ABQ5NWA9_9ACTN|nr:zf-HC2 domain-containing protein [Streptomyces sp. YSPA8]GLF94653.1 zf-HC2 domain-containing protein [Streptomyces sp. YSPA8]